MIFKYSFIERYSNGALYNVFNDCKNPVFIANIILEMKVDADNNLKVVPSNRFLLDDDTNVAMAIESNEYDNDVYNDNDEDCFTIGNEAVKRVDVTPPV